MPDDLGSESELSAKSAVKKIPSEKPSATSGTFSGYPLTTCALAALTN
jgi:hypothetical protein